MKKYLLEGGLIFIYLIVVLFIDYKINLLDLNYYNGKDGGLMLRFETSIIMSVVFFIVMSKNNKILFSLLGIIIGVFSTIISYLLLGSFTTLDDVFYQLGAIFLFTAIFHFIDKRFSKL